MLENKKAQNLPITTIILIVLGIVVLVVLIIGFTSGWDTFKEWFTGGGAGTEKYVSECAVACSTNNIGGWCDAKYTIEGKANKQSCDNLAPSKIEDSCPDIKCGSEVTDEQCRVIKNPSDKECPKTSGCIFSNTERLCVRG